MYGKWYAQTYTGSMFGRGPSVFAVWGYVVAHAYNSAVEMNPALIAASIGDSVENVEAALEYLCAPDNASRSLAEGGRRLIREGQYIYRVPTHDLYRGLRHQEDRREYNRQKKAEGRERTKKNTTPIVNPPSAMSNCEVKHVSRRQPPSAAVSRRQPITDSSTTTLSLNTKSKVKVKSFIRPTLEEIRQEVAARGGKIDPEQFFNFYESKGWKVGAQAMKNWKAAIVTWEKREREQRPKAQLPASEGLELKRQAMERLAK